VDTRDTSKGLEGAHVGSNPVGETLRPGRFDIGIVGSTKHCNEDRGLMDLATVAVDDGDTLAGIIDKEFLPGAVTLAHD
jgi:hypothetical protein